MNLVRALRSVVRHNGPRPAMLDVGRSFSWAEFGDRVARAAAALQALGVAEGMRFAVLARNGFRYEELKWAGFWLGAVPVPVNWRLAPLEIAHILDDAEAAALLVEDHFQPVLAHDALAGWKDKAFLIGDIAGPSRGAYEEWLARSGPLAPADPDPEDDALLVYTGGTTGRSKGVRLTHRNILSNGVAFGLAVSATREQPYLHAAPMFHSADLLAMGWMLQGAPQCFLPAFTPDAFLDAVARYRVGAVVTVPTMLIAIVTSPALATADVSSLRTLIYGAAPMAVEWIERVARAFPKVGLCNSYGLTETAPDLTVFDPAEFRAAIDRMIATGDRTGPLTSVGKPNPLNEVRVVRPDGSDAAPGETGELLARGPNIMKGYWKRDAETAAALAGGWLHTGDVASIDEDGYVYLRDRLKDMVISGGENVYSSVVEAVLFRHPAVLEAAIIGVPDERLGETVMAVIVPKPGTGITEAEITAHCRAALGGYKIPRRIAFVDKLPKSAMGKILKGELRGSFAKS
ncbi:MAG: AMP-binding protein [Rhodospirillaceae bacterium]|nr:AMP-binding protein [Rhodospirillaceae bacterium]